MDAPCSEKIVSAVRQLRLLGAVSEADNKLTELDRKMAGFPLQPRLTAAILTGAEIGCAEEVLTIIVLVNGETGRASLLLTLQTKMKIVSANGMGVFKVQICRPMTEQETRPALSCHIIRMLLSFPSEG